MDEKYLPQVYLEELKYKAKKTKMWRFINAELKSDSDDDSADDFDDDFDDNFDDYSDNDSDSDSDK